MIQVNLVLFITGVYILLIATHDVMRFEESTKQLHEEVIATYKANSVYQQENNFLFSK